MKTPQIDLERLATDMTLRGWNARELARQAELSPKTVGFYLDGTRQTPKTLLKIATALGYPVRRYVKIPRRFRSVA
jgi:transcriptional regulator with XRE-family HTH domain